MGYNNSIKKFEGYIYCITNIVNKKQYIGQTCRSLGARWNEHIKASISTKKYTYIHTAISKYGVENFSFTVLLYINADTKDSLIKLLNDEEVRHISIYNTQDPNGYNQCEGGYNLINTFSEKCVVQYDVDCNIIQVFPSISEASRVTGIEYSDISHCCAKKKIKTAGGFIWCYKDDKPPKGIKLKNKKVTQYDTYGNVINCFDSQVDAALCLNLDNANISSCCRGLVKTCGGYVWRFNDDSFNKYDVHINNKKPVVQYSMNNVFIKRYNSISEAGSSCNISPNNIIICCKNKRKYAGDFIWKYEKDVAINLN